MPTPPPIRVATEPRVLFTDRDLTLGFHEVVPVAVFDLDVHPAHKDASA